MSSLFVRILIAAAAAVGGAIVVIGIFLAAGEVVGDSKLSGEVLTDLRVAIATDCNSECDISKATWEEFLGCFDDQDDEDLGARQCTKILQAACKAESGTPLFECIALFVRLNRSRIEDIVDFF